MLSVLTIKQYYYCIYFKFRDHQLKIFGTEHNLLYKYNEIKN